MAYSERARFLRQCVGTRKDGERCCGWAMWEHPYGLQLCGQHAGRGHTGPQRARSFEQRWHDRSRGKGNVTPCTCAAYAWPHRPGGGVCRWPDLVVSGGSLIPAGKRHWNSQWYRRYRKRTPW
jgi:hypothetical protein